MQRTAPGFGLLPIAPVLLLLLLAQSLAPGRLATPIKPFVLQSRLEIDPTRVDEWLRAMDTDATGCRDVETGCLRFEVARIDREDGATNEFITWEVFDSRKSFELHRTMPHFLPWKKFKASGGVLSQRNLESVIAATSVLPGVMDASQSGGAYAKFFF